MTEETEDWRQETRDWPRGASWPREHPSLAERLHELLILFPQRPRPLAPRLSRRPSATAYGLGPSVFTIRAKEVGHGSCLGFPGRRSPGDPAASANVARGLQAPLAWRYSRADANQLPPDLLPSADCGQLTAIPGEVLTSSGCRRRVSCDGCDGDDLSSQ